MNLIRASQLLWVFVELYLHLRPRLLVQCSIFFCWVSFKSIGVSEEGISSYFLIKYEMYVFTLPFTNSASKLQFLVPYGRCGFFDIKRFSVWKFN